MWENARGDWSTSDSLKEYSLQLFMLNLIVLECIPGSTNGKF
jgi:hypothetical protein